MIGEKGETKILRTKEEGQQELAERFGMRNTSEFQLALQKGEVVKAEAWLQYIVDNKDNFPEYWQYGNWDSWLADRQKDIEIYKDFWDRKAAGQETREIVPRTKEEAQAELVERFGMAKTSDFRNALKAGDIEKAKVWLQYIIDNKDTFPQYQATWGKWLADRQREIEEAESK